MSLNLDWDINLGSRYETLSKILDFLESFLFFKIYLLEMKVTERDKDPLATHSLSKCLYWLGMGQAEVRSREIYLGLLGCGWHGPVIFSTSFPGVLA